MDGLNRVLPVYKYFVDPIEKRGIPSLPVFVLVVALLASAAFSFLGAPTQEFRAIVQTESGEFVDGATVTLTLADGTEFTAVSENGVARFPGVPATGTAALRVSKEGFADFTLEIDLGRASARVTLSPAGPATVTVTISVSSADGPVPGATVAYSTPEAASSAVTDALGVASFSAGENALVSYTVSAVGFERVTGAFLAVADWDERVFLSPAQPTPIVTPDPTLGQYGTVTVYVKDAVTGGVLNAQVSLFRVGAPDEQIGNKTATGGTASFANVPRDVQVYATAWLRGWLFEKSSTIFVQGGSGAQNRIDINLTPTPLGPSNATFLYTHAANGSPLAGVEFRLFHLAKAEAANASFDDYTLREQGTTDANGTANLSDFVDGAGYYYVLARKTGFLPTASERFSMGQDQNLTLEAATANNAASLNATVLNALTGVPASGASVRVKNALGQLLHPAALSNPEGLVIFANLPLGEAVRAKATKDALEGEAGVTLAAASNAVTVRLLPPTVPLTLTAKDDLGQSISGVLFNATLGDVPVGTCTGNPSCVIRIPTSLDVTVTGKRTGYLDASQTVNHPANTMPALSLFMPRANTSCQLLNEKNVCLALQPLRVTDFTGNVFYDAAATPTTSIALEYGDYVAWVSVFTANATSAGVNVRVGSELNVANGFSFTYLTSDAIAQAPPLLAIRGHATYDAGASTCPAGSALGDAGNTSVFQTRPALRWAELEFNTSAAPPAGTAFVVPVRFRVSPTYLANATLHNQASVNVSFRAFAREAGGQVYRVPFDANLGSAPAPFPAACNANATAVRLSLASSSGFACATGFCVKTSFEQVVNGVRLSGDARDFILFQVPPSCDGASSCSVGFARVYYQTWPPNVYNLRAWNASNSSILNLTGLEGAGPERGALAELAENAGFVRVDYGSGKTPPDAFFANVSNQGSFSFTNLVIKPQYVTTEKTRLSLHVVSEALRFDSLVTVGNATAPAKGAVCGDGILQANETRANCCADAGCDEGQICWALNQPANQRKCTAEGTVVSHACPYVVSYDSASNELRYPKVVSLVADASGGASACLVADGCYARAQDFTFKYDAISGDVANVGEPWGSLCATDVSAASPVFNPTPVAPLVFEGTLSFDGTGSATNAQCRTPDAAPTACRCADVNSDGSVTQADVDLVAAYTDRGCRGTASSSYALRADLRYDGCVNDLDVACAQAQVGQSCSQPANACTTDGIDNNEQFFCAYNAALFARANLTMSCAGLPVSMELQVFRPGAAPVIGETSCDVSANPNPASPFLPDGTPGDGTAVEVTVEFSDLPPGVRVASVSCDGTEADAKLFAIENGRATRKCQYPASIERRSVTPRASLPDSAVSCETTVQLLGTGKRGAGVPCIANAECTTGLHCSSYDYAAGDLGAPRVCCASGKVCCNDAFATSCPWTYACSGGTGTTSTAFQCPAFMCNVQYTPLNDTTVNVTSKFYGTPSPGVLYSSPTPRPDSLTVDCTLNTVNGFKCNAGTTSCWKECTIATAVNTFNEYDVSVTYGTTLPDPVCKQTQLLSLSPSCRTWPDAFLVLPTETSVVAADYFGTGTPGSVSISCSGADATPGTTCSSSDPFCYRSCKWPAAGVYDLTSSYSAIGACTPAKVLVGTKTSVGTSGPVFYKVATDQFAWAWDWAFSWTADDKGDRLTVPTSLSLNALMSRDSLGYSVSAFFNFTPPPASWENAAVARKWDAKSTPYPFSLFVYSNSSVACAVRGSNNKNVTLFSPALTDGKKHLITCVFDNSNAYARLYVDGEFVRIASISGLGKTTANTADLCFGNHCGTIGTTSGTGLRRWFKGAIAYFQIREGVMTADDVRREFEHVKMRFAR